MSEIAKQDAMQLPEGGLEKLLRNMIAELKHAKENPLYRGFYNHTKPFAFNATDEGRDIGISVQAEAGQRKIRDTATCDLRMNVTLSNVDSMFDWSRYAAAPVKTADLDDEDDDDDAPAYKEVSPLPAALTDTLRFIAESVPPEGLKITSLRPCDLGTGTENERCPEPSECFLITTRAGRDTNPPSVEIGSSITFRASQIDQVIEGLETLLRNRQPQSKAGETRDTIGGFNVPKGRLGPSVSGDPRGRPRETEEE